MKQIKLFPTSNAAFSQDEKGGMTILGLYLFGTIAIISAIAVDVSNLMSSETQLQVAADTAGHAALYARDTHSAEDAKTAAIQMAAVGMPAVLYGDVLTTEDIKFGTWDYDTQQFTVNPTSRDAVMVNAVRLASRSNSVKNYLFQMVGQPQFDVTTPAVFTTFYPMCFREGFVADGVVDIQSNNSYSNGFCLHSNEYVSLNSNNTFESGTVVSMPNLDDIDLPRSGYETNDGLQAALRSGVYRMRILNRIDSLISGLETGDPKYTPDYITNTTPITLTGGNHLDETDFTPGRIHVKTCSGNPKITLTPTVPLTEVVLVTDCEIKFSLGTALEDVVIATRHTGSFSMNAPAALRIGRDDGCAPGGDVQLITKGSMKFAADLEIYGGQFIAEGNIIFSANANGVEGASMVAGGTIDGTSNMDMAFCGSGMENNFEAAYFRLAR